MSKSNNNWHARLWTAVWMALSLSLLALIAGSLGQIRKEQQEIRQYLVLLYNDYEEYD